MSLLLDVLRKQCLHAYSKRKDWFSAFTDTCRTLKRDFTIAMYPSELYWGDSNGERTSPLQSKSRHRRPCVTAGVSPASGFCTPPIHPNLSKTELYSQIQSLQGGRKTAELKEREIHLREESTATSQLRCSLRILHKHAMPRKQNPKPSNFQGEEGKRPVTIFRTSMAVSRRIVPTVKINWEDWERGRER